MTEVAAVSGYEYKVKIGDGATPTEAFTHKCMINAERSASIEAQTTQTPIVDCDNPSKPNWNRTRKTSIGVTISGSGTFHKSEEKFFTDWAKSPDSKNVKYGLEGTGAETGAGKFHLTSFQVTGNDKDTMTASMTLVSDGAVTNTTNS